MKKKYLLGVCAVLLLIQADAQNKYQALKIGDKVPDIIMSHIINYPNSTAKLSDFKSKVILLDFWSLGCKACIAAFPKMEKIQQQFGDKLQVLLVNYYDNWEILERRGFPKESKSTIIKNTKLPFVIDCEALKQLFPHGSEPYHVWLDTNRIVKAMTAGYNATPEFISDFINSKNLLFEDRSRNIGYDSSRQISPEINLRSNKNIKYYSFINHIWTPNKKLSGPIIDSSTGKAIGYRFNQKSIMQLFQVAFGFKGPILHTVLELPNPDSYFFPVEDPNRMEGWLSQNMYNYEIKAPIEKMYEIMQRDLQVCFGIKARLEQRKIECWIIQRTTNESKAIAKDPDAESFIESSANLTQLENVLFGMFVETFRSKNTNKWHSKSLPILDETGFETIKVNMEIKADLTDIPSLNREFKKYGLHVILAKKTLRVLVLTKE